MALKKLQDGAYRPENRRNRIFSNEFKKAKVADIVEKKITVTELSRLYGVSRSAIYNWIRIYDPHYETKTRVVIEMQSESQKTKELLQRVAELERIVGQKQLEIDFLGKLMELASKELNLDIKKKYSTSLSNGSDDTGHNTIIL
jgi:transposase-like protein